MKSFVKPILTVIFLILFFSVFAVHETQAQIQEILRRMEAHHQSLVTLRTKVLMEKYNSQLKETNVSQGTAIYLNSTNERLYGRVDWTKPFQETLSVHGNRFVLYRANLKQALTGNLTLRNENSEFLKNLSILRMSKKELKANYRITYYGVEKVMGIIETVHLEFKPKNISAFKTTELWVDKFGMPVQLKITENNNHFTRILLSDFTKNTAMDAKEFKVTLPVNTKIIKSFGYSCVCPPPSKAKEILENKADAVFSGKIVEAKENIYTFQAEKFWKGSPAKKIIVESLAVFDNCQTKLVKGEKYIVFAEKSNSPNSNRLILNPCNLTIVLSSEIGKKIIKELGKENSTKKQPKEQKRKSAKKKR